jgi:hypothetical protein
MAAYFSRQRNREAGCVMVRPMLTVKCFKCAGGVRFGKEKTYCINVRLVIVYLYWSNICVIKSRGTRLAGPVARVREKA